MYALIYRGERLYNSHEETHAHMVIFGGTSNIPDRDYLVAAVAIVGIIGMIGLTSVWTTCSSDTPAIAQNNTGRTGEVEVDHNSATVNTGIQPAQ